MKKRIFTLPALIIGAVIIFQLLSTCLITAQTKHDDNLLSIIVMVDGSKIKVKGYCLYMKEGKELKKELEKDNAWGWNFHGEYIKEVKMWKVSGDASFRLFVMEGKDAASGKTLFESKPISSTKPVIYKRDIKDKTSKIKN